MATLLMIESWLRSTGEALPPLLRALGHDYVLVTRDPGLYGAAGPTPHPALSGAADVVVVDTNDTAAVVARAVELAARRRVDGVVTATTTWRPRRPSPTGSVCRARRPG